MMQDQGPPTRAQAQAGLTCESFVAEVHALAAKRLEEIASAVNLQAQLSQLLPGKMLRTRLAGHLWEELSPSIDLVALHRLCAAVEIVHTASLCHDDIIDNALIRRAKPVLWRATCASGAILVGDLLLCESIALLVKTEAGRHLPQFIENVRQVIEAEARQELVFRGRQMDVETCLWLARNKTGPLFSFLAAVCGGPDEALSQALEQAGYHIGTAYQLADDLLDLIGQENAAGKTLGTDARRGLFTLAQSPDEATRITHVQVRRLCASALELLEAYPPAHTAVKQFFAHDFQPVLNCHRDVSMDFAI